MPKCDKCAVEFFPGGSGWSACGECIAAEIELSLLQELRLGPRKPMRRASTSPGERDGAEETGEARKTA